MFKCLQIEKALIIVIHTCIYYKKKKIMTKEEKGEIVYKHQKERFEKFETSWENKWNDIYGCIRNSKK